MTLDQEVDEVAEALSALNPPTHNPNSPPTHQQEDVININEQLPPGQEQEDCDYTLEVKDGYTCQIYNDGSVYARLEVGGVQYLAAFGPNMSTQGNVYTLDGYEVGQAQDDGTITFNNNRMAEVAVSVAKVKNAAIYKEKEKQKKLIERNEDKNANANEQVGEEIVTAELKVQAADQEALQLAKTYNLVLVSSLPFQLLPFQLLPFQLLPFQLLLRYKLYVLLY